MKKPNSKLPKYPKIRRNWGNVKPITKIRQNAKLYNRKKIKDQIDEEGVK